MKLEIFDPPMCCSSGVCGPKVDPALPRIAADLEWLKKQGIAVARVNLSQQPLAFVENELVKSTLTKDGKCLPLTLLDGQIIAAGRYPSRAEVAGAICTAMRSRNEDPAKTAPDLAQAAAGTADAAKTAQPCGCNPTASRNSGKCCG